MLGYCKLNMDGYSLGNLSPSGGGGILRDSDGDFLFGFSIPLGTLTSVQAEVKSLRFGLQQCLSRGYSNI